MPFTSQLSENTHSSNLQVAPLNALKNPNQTTKFKVSTSNEASSRNTPFPQQSDQADKAKSPFFPLTYSCRQKWYDPDAKKSCL